MASQENRDWVTLRGIVRRRGRREVALKLLEMPNERPKSRRRSGSKQYTSVEAYHFMEKALDVLGADGADEEELHRAAAALVQEATGLRASTVRRKHREVARTLTPQEREDYRRSLRVRG